MEISSYKKVKKHNAKSSTSNISPVSETCHKEDITFRVSVLILYILGQWPPPDKHAVRNMLIVLLVTTTLMSMVILTLMHFTIPGASILLVFIEKVPAMSSSALILVLMGNIIRNCKSLEETVMLMRNDWNDQRTPEENEIKEKSLTKGKNIAQALAVSVILGMFSLLSYGLAAPVQDYFMPLNESRVKKLPFSLEYFDQQKYFFWLFFYIFLAAIAVHFVILPLGMFHAIAATHICGMFHVVGYKLQNIKHLAKTTMEDAEGNFEKSLINTVKASVREHQKAFRIIETYSAFAKGNVPPNVVQTVVIGCTAFVEVSYIDHITPKPIVFAGLALTFYYFMNYVGQALIDSTANIFWNAYNSSWYDYPLAAQKLLLIIMERSYKYYSLKVTGFDEASIATFSAVLRTAVSYCLTVRQMQ